MYIYSLFMIGFECLYYKFILLIISALVKHIFIIPDTHIKKSQEIRNGLTLHCFHETSTGRINSLTRGFVQEIR